MHIIKKLLILVIIVASFFIIHSLMQENTMIKKKIQTEIDNNTKETNKEGFQATVSEEITELQKSAEKKGLELKIKPIDTKYQDFPLREFMIKSSYNSAIINKTASKDAVLFAIGRGCRLLDFEIYTRDNVEYISYSEDPEYRTIHTGLTLSLENALIVVASNAFSNTNDPMFIQLRIKNNSKEAYNRISKLLNEVFGKKLYGNTETIKVNGSTPIKHIMGRVVIILDALSAPDYDKYGEKSLIPQVGMISGSVDLPKYSYSEYYDLTQSVIMVNNKTGRTDVKTFMMIAPPEIGGNIMTYPNKETLEKLPVQMFLVPFYRQTDELKNYEEIFNDCESSFCTLGEFMRNSNKKNAEK